MPTFELRNRLAMAHERAADANERAAVLHDEAAAFWYSVHDDDEAEAHRRQAPDHYRLATANRAEAALYRQPSKRQQ